jgi:hypothetical protein
MKELFDQLRDLMPQERGSKASKWEILTKGRSPAYVSFLFIPANPADSLASNFGTPKAERAYQTAASPELSAAERD